MTDTNAPIKLCVMLSPDALLRALPDYGETVRLDYLPRRGNVQNFAALVFPSSDIEGENMYAGALVDGKYASDYSATVPRAQLAAYLARAGTQPLEVYATAQGYRFQPVQTHAPRPTPTVRPLPQRPAIKPLRPTPAPPAEDTELPIWLR